MRKQTTTVTLSIRTTLPKGSNVAELLDYVRNAIASHGGGLDPEDHYFHARDLGFTVNLVKKETTYG